ncbi:MAG: hypothetical protein KF779_10370 [Hyphomonadaceae bacterium]|nr:hypothetical protein [Hyphomonadaceae bacterium]
MDATEVLVERYLLSLGLGEVVFEPDGNIAPDFVVGGRIAVEVRRLNVSVDAGKGMEGLEETAISLRGKMLKLLESYGPSTSGETWAVGYTFRRPISTWRTLERPIRSVLDGFGGAKEGDRKDFQLERGFRLKLRRLTPGVERYVPLGEHDLDAGGYVVPMVTENLVHCIAEKSAKIAPHKHKYAEWWLVMPDFTNNVLHVLSGPERLDVAVAHVFDRIVVIDPDRPARALEVVTTDAGGFDHVS